MPFVGTIAHADWSISPSSNILSLIEDGFGEGAKGEDPFDSLVGVLGMLHIVNAQRTLFEPKDDITRQVEGWIFGRKLLQQRTINE